MFDAEGSFSSGILRIAQKDVSVLKDLIRMAYGLGFLFEYEKFKGPCSTIRMAGKMRNAFRFLTTVRPAIARKNCIYDTTLRTDFEPIISKQLHNEPRELIDIQTSTRTFFAAGFATHNCYAADKTVQSKRIDTTKRTLPLIGGGHART